MKVFKEKAILIFLTAALSCRGPEPDISEIIFPIKTWTDISEGTLPLVLIVPHGGDLKPPELPDRKCTECVIVNDTYTRELAQAIDAEFIKQTGERPFMVINRLHRTKFDGNRDLAEATGGYEPLSPFWFHFHNAIDSALNKALRLHSRVLVLDLHGHGHEKQRLELGYLLTASELRKSDAEVSLLMNESSVAGLAEISGERVSLLRGNRSLGSFFEINGVPAVPSPSDPAPLSSELYFNGGFNTDRYGSVNGGKTDAIQIECHYSGVRNSSASRAAFAAKFAEAVTRYLEVNYGWK